MSVVLRCPNCGTTQSDEGECEACTEVQVQYFCTNHDEGIWLDGRVCSQCGANFGDPPKRPAPAPSPTRVSARLAGAPDFRPPTRRRTPETPEVDLGMRPPRSAGDHAADSDVLPPTPSLAELLEEITEAHGRTRPPYEVPESPWARPPRDGVRFPVAGCLIRTLGLGLLLFVAFVIFLFLLFGAVVGG